MPKLLDIAEPWHEKVEALCIKKNAPILIILLNFFILSKEDNLLWLRSKPSRASYDFSLSVPAHSLVT